MARNALSGRSSAVDSAAVPTLNEEPTTITNVCEQLADLHGELRDLFSTVEPIHDWLTRSGTSKIGSNGEKPVVPPLQEMRDSVAAMRTLVSDIRYSVEKIGQLVVPSNTR